MLRNTEHVNQDIQEIYAEASQGKSNESFGLKQLFQDKDLTLPLVTSIVICSIQQFSGINAVFFYSSDNKFVLKTITPEEFQFIDTNLFYFHEHFIRNPDSILAKIYGLFTFKGD